MFHTLFKNLVSYFLPKAIYKDYRVVKFFEYNYETEVFEPLNAYVLQLENEDMLNDKEKVKLTTAISEILSLKVFLESESSAPIF